MDSLDGSPNLGFELSLLGDNCSTDLSGHPIILILSDLISLSKTFEAVQCPLAEISLRKHSKGTQLGFIEKRSLYVSLREQS